MIPKVSVVDYGIGNLLSVCRALEYVGAEPVLASAPASIAESDRVVLPGVGAFGPAMQTLSGNGMVDALVESAVEKQRPFLGICLGMQMMLERSTEFGEHAGMGFIPGDVDRIPATGDGGRKHRIPHIGWAPLMPSGGADWRESPLQGSREGEDVYFVHSFVAKPADPRHCIGITEYDGISLAAVVGEENKWGCQFHPEKSGEAGLNILRNFLLI